jgi:hypothetical protein
MALSQAHWNIVRRELRNAKAITWDTCHKIYVLMDDQQVKQSEEWGYDPILPVTDVDEALATLQQWYDESCGLRFITAVTTVESDPNKGYDTLIGQFDDEEDEEDY